MPQLIATTHLPINLPEVEKYLPTEEGEPPLGRATTWAWDTEANKVVSNNNINHKTVFPLELNTMPGWAGSSWYLFRYMDANNTTEFASAAALQYWKNVDLYVGGSEHGTGHLLYSRFWTKFLADKGYLSVEEPFQKMINQGMILGTSAFVYKATPFVKKGCSLDDGTSEDITKKIPSIFVSKSAFRSDDEFEKVVIDYLLDNKVISSLDVDVLVIAKSAIHVDVSFVNASDELDITAFKNWRADFKEAQFILNDEKYIVGREVEKMSKSKFNVVNPDDICTQYGADTLRLYEMFLGPLEQAKPWKTAGITGVHNFLKKMWKLYVGENGVKFTDAAPTKENLKTLHKTIKKVVEDIENFSFNTSVSTFMIAVNELSAQKCTSKKVLQSLAILISPYAPHIAEELWSLLGNNESIAIATFPVFEASHLVESVKEYPVSFNGKMRFKLELPLDMSKDEIEKIVMAHEKTAKQLAGRTPKKVIIVPGKIINIVG